MALHTALLAGALSLGSVLLGAPAASAVTEGRCTDGAGVTVVVDLTELGGATTARCAALPLAGGGTGVDALRAAGFAPEGVLRWGEAFICRIAGRPTAAEKLSIPRRSGYREQCVDTPPATAYWSYWRAAPGAEWAYSSAGARSAHPEAGTSEGWRFTLGSDKPEPPSLPPAKVVPAVPVTSTPAPTTEDRPATTASRPTTGSSSTAPATDPRASRSTPAPSASTDTSTSPSTVAEEPPGATPTPTPTLMVALAAPAVSAPNGPSPAALGGVGLLAFLVVAGAGTAWRRRKTL